MRDENFVEQIQIIWDLGINGKVLVMALLTIALFIICGIVNVARETYADFVYAKKVERNSARNNHPTAFVADSTDDIWGD